MAVTEYRWARRGQGSLSTIIPALMLILGAHGCENQNLSGEGRHDKEIAMLAENENNELLYFEKDLQGEFNGASVQYKVVAREMALRTDSGDPKAAIFSTTYMRNDARLDQQRPVMFFFNGGPGSSSVWLHMGVFGPFRTFNPNDPENVGAPPYPLVHNPESLLDIADLVFVDPVGTGYSRALGDAKPTDFWGVKEDAQSMAEFIQLWLSEYNRWNSPKFLVGESYGTTRVARLTDLLQSPFTGINLNGLIFIGAAIDNATLRAFKDNDLALIGFLPSYAATAWRHETLANKPEDFESFLDEARHFAVTEYASALLAGTTLSDKEKIRIAQKYAYFTGLSADYVLRAGLRVVPQRYLKELLRRDGKTLGYLDSRYGGPDADDNNDVAETDHSFSGTHAGFAAAINHYFRETVGVVVERPYVLVDMANISKNWNWQENPGAVPHLLNLMPMVGKALRENPDLHALFLNGYYDFATPFFSSELAIRRNDIPTDRVIEKTYRSGHFLYLEEETRRLMNADIRIFLANALQSET